MYCLHDGIIEYGFLSKHNVRMAGHWQLFILCVCVCAYGPRRGQSP